MTCVTTTLFFILLIGKPYGNVTSFRGIRQGDPFLPYLFLLCSEGFTSLLAKAETDGKIHGASICRGALKFLTYCLQMIPCCFARQHKMRWR